MKNLLSVLSPLTDGDNVSRESTVVAAVLKLNEKLLLAGVVVTHFCEGKRPGCHKDVSRQDSNYRAAMAKIEYDKWVKADTYGKV